MDNKFGVHRTPPNEETGEGGNAIVIAYAPHAHQLISVDDAMHLGRWLIAQAAHTNPDQAKELVRWLQLEIGDPTFNEPKPAK